MLLRVVSLANILLLSQGLVGLAERSQKQNRFRRKSVATPGKREYIEENHRGNTIPYCDISVHSFNLIVDSLCRFY